MRDQGLNSVLRSIRRVAASQSTGTLSDSDLLGRFILNRDEAAFESLVWRHAKMVWNICCRVLRHPQDAEDAFQATFLILVRRARSIQRKEALAGWLYKVAYRVALERKTLTAKRSFLPLPEQGVSAKENSDPDSCDLRPLLDQEISLLPDKYRAAVVLCYLEGKSDDEAARELGCARGTIHSRLARARERLRRRLIRRGVTLGVGSLASLAGSDSFAGVVPSSLVWSIVRAGSLLVSGKPLATVASIPVATLIQGAMRTMLLSKLNLVAIAILTLGVATAATAFTKPLQPRDTGFTGTSSSLRDASTGGLTSTGDDLQDSEDFAMISQKMKSQNNLKQIALALHTYHDANGHFPAAAIYDDNGKALLSWRVAILPYLEQERLYKQFRLNEPWNSTHNKRLLALMPLVFAPPGKAEVERDQTFYQVFVSDGRQNVAPTFEKNRTTRISDITDGTSNTIMVIEARTAVPWTKPEDLVYDPKQPLPKLGGIFENVVNAALCDGSVHAFRKDAPQTAMRAMITRNGGEVYEGLHAATVRRNDADPRARNRALKDAVRKATERLRTLTEELDTIARADVETAKLNKENTELEELLDRTHRRIDELETELARLKGPRNR
jgi:RNA polymerase sigma factor (sigma-70 family)